MRGSPRRAHQQKDPLRLWARNSDSKKNLHNAGDAQLNPPRGYAKTWTLEKGKLREDLPVDEVLKKMDARDVFIKGANAIDPYGNARIFLGSPIGGTVGRVVGSAMAKGITIVIPVGLEKIIPTPIAHALRL